MMKKMMLLSLSAVLLAGCAMTDPMGMAQTRPGLACKGCGSLWVADRTPTVKPGLFMMRKHRQCNYCSQMAAKYFATGRLEGTCPQCGKNMRVCAVRITPAPTTKTQ